MEALIVAIVFSVPLSAIVGAYWVKVKRLELEAGAKDVEPRLRALEAENRELRERVEVLARRGDGGRETAEFQCNFATEGSN